MTNPNQTIIIFDFMRTLYDPESDQLIAGATELLTFLQAAGFCLYLVSRKEGQRRSRMDELGIGSYFADICLVENKLKTMKMIQQKHIEHTIWVVGDRVRGEITAGNMIGAVTVWFKQGLFASEKPMNSEEQPDFTITKLTEIRTLVS